MFKRILKVLLAVVLVLALLVVAAAVAYKVIYAGVPYAEVAATGQDSLVVPADLQKRDTNIKVMTYNIRLLTREKWREHYWSNRREPMIGQLERLDADIIGFQEVTHPRCNTLSSIWVMSTVTTGSIAQALTGNEAIALSVIPIRSLPC